MKSINCRFASTVLLLACMGQAFAADDEMEEITVTATKIGSVSVQSIPAGIAAVTGASLEQSNVRSLGDLARLVPSLQMGQIAPGDLQPIIRGIQSPGAGTVGVYFDETVITGVNFQNGGGRTPDVGAYDISRVEVLKGPQGSLFGASSMSGTVRFISNKPDAKAFDTRLSIRGDTLKGGDAGGGGDAMVNIPLIPDVLAVRAVGWYEKRGGFIDAYHGLNAATKVENANVIKKYGGRLMLRYTPSEDLTFDAYYMKQKLTDGGTLGYNNVPNSTQLPIPIFAGAPFLIGLTIPGMDGVAADRVMTAPADNYNSSAISLYGGTASYDMGFGSLVATASKYDNDPYFFAYDTTGTTNSFGLIDFPLFFTTGELAPQAPFQVNQQQIRGIFSGEVRFNSQFEGPFNFVTGFFYQREDADTKLIVVITDPVTGKSYCTLWRSCIEDVNSLAARSLLFATEETYVVNSNAFFGHANYEFTDKLKLEVGARYFEMREHAINYTQQAFQGSIPFTVPPSSGGVVNTVSHKELDVRLKESKTTWDASLSYQRTPDEMYYTRVATGFRQGGPNDTVTAIQLGIVIPDTFQPDVVTSYEIGAKTRWLDHRLTLNGAIFRMDWKDMQVPGQDRSGVITYINNAAKAKITGVEVELAAAATERLHFTLGTTYIDAKLTEDQVSESGPAGLDGDRIPKVPHWTASATGEYTLPGEVLGSTATFRANMSYTGESTTFFNSSFANNLPIGNYFLMNTSINFARDNWDLRFFVNNILDRTPTLDIFGQGKDPIQKITTEPRSVGLQLSWSMH